MHPEEEFPHVGFPVEVSVELVAFGCHVEGRHAEFHNEEHDAKSKHISFSSVEAPIEFAFVDFWGLVAVSALVLLDFGVDCIDKSEVA